MGSYGKHGAKADTTKRRILESAKAEFLAKGYSRASLRSIAKAAGVTTGALYGYFKDKDAIFETIVGEHATWFYREFEASHEAFDAIDADRQVGEMRDFTLAALLRLTDYIFDHYDAFRLLVCASTGSSFERWLDIVIRIEEESTKSFIERLRSSGYPVKAIGDDLVHMLCTSFFQGIMETVAHGMDRQAARNYIILLREYSNAGWNVILGITR